MCIAGCYDTNTMLLRQFDKLTVQEVLIDLIVEDVGTTLHVVRLNLNTEVVSEEILQLEERALSFIHFLVHQQLAEDTITASRQTNETFGMFGKQLPVEDGVYALTHERALVKPFLVES